MAMRAPTRWVPEVVQEVADNPTAFGRGMLTVLQGGLEWGAAEEVGAESIGGAAAIAVAASGIGDVIAIVVIVVVLAIAILGTILHHFFRGPLSSVPLLGGRLAGISDVAFGWTDNLVTWCAHSLQSLAGAAFRGFVAAVNWAIQQAGNSAGTVSNALIYEQVHPVKVEVDHLWLWVNDINRWVGNVAAHVGVAASAASAEPGNVLGQLAQLQRDLSTLTEYARSIDGKVGQLASDVGLLSHAVTQLAVNTGAARAVNVGWQDMETTLNTLSLEVQRLESTVMPEVATIGQKVNTLYPLGVLLAAGALGLENLRKLEDNPCQCPQLGGIGGVWSTIMAAKHELKGD